MKNTTHRFRRGYSVFYVLFIIIWTLTSWTIYTELGVQLKESTAFKIATLPVFLLSWPAGQISLEITGYGFGHNMGTIPAAPWSFLLFFVQTSIIWFPLATLCLQRIKIWPCLFAQTGIIFMLLCFFWQFGNG